MDKKRNLIRETVVRFTKAMIFWGMAGLLASASYTEVLRIEEQVAESAETVTANAITGQEASATEEQVAENAETVTAEGTTGDDVSATEEPVEVPRVALTFDDGPHPVYTKELLDGLEEREVRASFFLIGKNIPGNEELVERMFQAGHLVGNHTYDHVKLSGLAPEEACSQVEQTSALVREITGEDTEFVRPPFGEWQKGMECSFVMIPVMWEVDPLDWTTKNTALVVQRVLSDVEPGDIILLHDCYASSVEAALQIVDELMARGYEFVTADKLILE